MLSALIALLAAGGAGGATGAELPDPLQRGSFAVERTDPLKLGQVTFQEPSSSGGAATGANSTITAQVRGVLYQPGNYPGASPLIFLVHGNHGSCDPPKEGARAPGGPKCEAEKNPAEELGFFKRNDEGYAYLGENLASWGYTVFSLDQDELMARQDGLGKGMHNRRLLMMAALDALKAANEAAQPETADSNVADLLVGKLDMTRIGLMGHSRGGDAVSSFVEYDHTRPVGERYPLRAVISLAPVDYERHVPYGVPYMTVFGSCDGDVSNLQGARLYERSQYSGDPYPRFQVEQIGGNHDAYNTVWQADGDDAAGDDPACGPDVRNGEPDAANPHSIRLSGEAGPHFETIYKAEGVRIPGVSKPYEISYGSADKLNPAVNTRISGDPALMGDQEKLGLATMAAFLRRYVGGEGAFEPYLTGELAAEGKPSIPPSACPTSDAGARIPCIDRVADSYTAPPAERLDVIRPDTEHPTTVSALGTRITATGFANPYPARGGITPRPATTPNGIDWCNPDPKQQEPGQLKEGENPSVAKPCPNPGLEALGGQGSGTRERAPVNGSYGRQLSVAWEEPVENTGAPAKLSTTIPAADADLSGYRALYMAAAVNFFDARNPDRGAEGLWNPEAAPQNFTIAVTDASGQEASVEAADPRYGTALQQTLGNTPARVHVILRDVRVPLADLAAQGVDLTRVRTLQLRFGAPGMPQSGSIQLADVSFQQPATGFSDVLLDSIEPNAGPGEGEPASGPNPVAELQAGVYQRADGGYELPAHTKTPGASVWTVDDNGAQCPNAQFEHIQEAVEFASPWDTIVVCAGVYPEASTPVTSAINPVQSGARNGLTINKPLKIVGAGASRVTIKPAASLGNSLAGTEPFLRDGGGNVVTISRQSLGSTEYDEEFVDISGVTIESPGAYVDAGVAFFNSSGRIADSVIGPLRRVAAGELAAKPHGYGVIATNSLLGAGSGSPERQVTIVGSRVFGYQSGGIRFDDARGADAAATGREPSGIKEVGYVRNTTVEGSGASTTIPQVGIQYHAGAAGTVTASRIAGNLFTTDQRKSAGVLLTGAGQFSIAGSEIVGNGFGLFNADVANAEVREGAPAQATGNWWGAGGTPIAGPTVSVEEGVSGEDGEGNPSVLFAPVAASVPLVPQPPALLPDSAPVGGFVNPGDGAAVEPGATLEPVVLAEDDYGVRSVSLTADGVPLGARMEAPYAFSWTPPAADAGRTVTLKATIADSSGQVETSTISVPVKARVAPPVVKVPPSSSFALGRVSRFAKRGTAALSVQVPGPGTLTIAGPKVKAATLNPTAAGEESIPIRPTAQALASLARRGRLTVRVTLAYTPTGGAPATVTRTVLLVKR